MLNLKNLGTRIASGAVFVAILIGGILYNEYSFVFVFSIITILALYEFYGLLNKSKIIGVQIDKLLNTIGGLLLFISSYTFFSNSIRFPFFAIYILYLIILFSSELFLKKKNPIAALSYAALGQMYIALPLSLLFYLGLKESYSYVFVLPIFIFIWVNDSFAYLSGSLLGKHKMFERISPKKSWEGFVGGALFAIIAAIIYGNYFPQLSLFGWIGFAIVSVIFGTLGDLIESLFKRTLEVKDSGNMIPGHGGLLDRIDSVIFAIPALFVYLELLAYVQSL